MYLKTDVGGIFMKFICERCKRIYKSYEIEPVEYTEHYDYWGSVVSETFSVFHCPICGREVEEFWGVENDYDELDEGTEE